MGRILFSRFGMILTAMAVVLRIVPKGLRRIMWSLTSPFEGVIAVGLRYVLLKSLSKSVGSNVYVGSYVILKNAQGLVLGENISIHAYTYIDAIGGIEIGDNVSIAHGCSLVSFDHTWSQLDTAIKYNPVVLDAIVIADDVWLGCGVRVLSGSAIGSRCVVAAGAVVTATLESGAIYGGVPARRIKAL